MMVRRALTGVLGPFNTELKTDFDFDYWLRAFSSCPERIDFLPSVQAAQRHNHSWATLSPGHESDATDRTPLRLLATHASGRNAQ